MILLGTLLKSAKEALEDDTKVMTTMCELKEKELKMNAEHYKVIQELRWKEIEFWTKKFFLEYDKRRHNKPEEESEEEE